MKKILSIASVLVFSTVLQAQSLVTAIEYLGAAASANAAQKQNQQARGEQPSTKVAFQMDVELSGRVHWGSNSILATGITYKTKPLKVGGNTTVFGGPGINLNLGVRINDSYFVGVGAQFEANFGNTKVTLGSEKYTVKATNMAVPIYGVFKIYLPSPVGVSPYFDLALGGYIPDWYILKDDSFKDYEWLVEGEKNIKIKGNELHYRAEKGGFYGHAAVGVDINHFQISAGYELTTYTEDSNTRKFHNIFLKVGYRIGG